VDWTKVRGPAIRQGIAAKYGDLVTKALQVGTLRGACPYCPGPFQVKETLEKAHIPFIDSPTEHPDLGEYVDQGYEVLVL
jgi:hypothetical protein